MFVITICHLNLKVLAVYHFKDFGIFALSPCALALTN